MLENIFVALIGVVIMYYSKENLEVVKESLNTISTILDSSVIGFLILWEKWQERNEPELDDTSKIFMYDLRKLKGEK